MSYSEKDGQVILTMSRKDYEQMQRVMLFGRGHIFGGERWVYELMARISQGNPNYTPYQVEAEKK